MVAVFKFGCLIFLGFGIFVLTQVALPFLSYQWWEWTTLRQNTALIQPTSQAAVTNGFYTASQVLGVSVAQANEDLTVNLPGTQRVNKPAFDTFTLTIPKLNITQALVKVDGENADKSLVLLPGTALPGEKGNVFIAGHSNYFQIFEQDNWYLSIFKNLHELKAGDEVITTTQGQDFRYKIVSMKVVDPKDISVIRPPDTSGRYITLMTCVPPGTFMKRLIVLGRLQ